MQLQRALLLLTATTVFASIVPAGIAIDRRLAQEVEARARADLAQAPRLLNDRNAGQTEAMLMHAHEIARAAGLAEALSHGKRAEAIRAAESARGSFGEMAVIVAADGRTWKGPAPSASMLASVRAGKSPTAIVVDRGGLALVTLVSVTRGNVWLGAAGVSTALDRAAAGLIASLTRADVLFAANNTVVASTLNDSVTTILRTQILETPRDGQVRLLSSGVTKYLVAATQSGEAATTFFVRYLSNDLAVLPAFRRVIIVSAAVAVLLGLALGTLVAQRIAQPVSALADAADRLAAGDVHAPLMRSSIKEIDRLSDAFASMRHTVATRISDVTGDNRRLTDQQTRFETSQSEILQRERLAVSSRLVAELSHEIRNPIANLRNCLEIVRRRVEHDAQAREFTDLAIDELLRMHELAEQLLDLNRPSDPAVRIAGVNTIIREVVVLSTAGHSPEELSLDIDDTASAIAAIAPDALKQVLLNLVQNAREAAGDTMEPPPSSVHIRIATSCGDDLITVSVSDNGPGIAPEVLPRVFDPFFTTKGKVHGVGLGLFVAQGLVRTAGGRIVATNMFGGGAAFQVELPVARLTAPSQPLMVNA
ncbi:MAG: ATP-binding protein [Gemmatimonadota bacterium]|nr:ATP-binding protein [Gemmatimonadota bacterium]